MEYRHVPLSHTLLPMHHLRKGNVIRTSVPTACDYPPLCSTMIVRKREVAFRAHPLFSPVFLMRRKALPANRHGDFGRSRGETRDQSKAELPGTPRPRRPLRYATAQRCFDTVDSRRGRPNKHKRVHASGLFVMRGRAPSKFSPTNPLSGRERLQQKQAIPSARCIKFMDI